MSNLYSEDFRIGEIKNTSRYASISYNKSKKPVENTAEAVSLSGNGGDMPADNADNDKNAEIITDTGFNVHTDRIITFHMKMLLCAQIVLCIIFTFMVLEFSKKPENYYNAKKLYGAIQNSSEIHKLEETLIAAKNDLFVRQQNQENGE